MSEMVPSIKDDPVPSRYVIEPSPKEELERLKELLRKRAEIDREITAIIEPKD